MRPADLSGCAPLALLEEVADTHPGLLQALTTHRSRLGAAGRAWKPYSLLPDLECWKLATAWGAECDEALAFQKVATAFAWAEGRDVYLVDERVADDVLHSGLRSPIHSWAAFVPTPWLAPHQVRGFWVRRDDDESRAPQLKYLLCLDDGGYRPLDVPTTGCDNFLSLLVRGSTSSPAPAGPPRAVGAADALLFPLLSLTMLVAFERGAARQAPAAAGLRVWNIGHRLADEVRSRRPLRPAPSGEVGWESGWTPTQGKDDQGSTLVRWHHREKGAFEASAAVGSLQPSTQPETAEPGLTAALAAHRVTLKRAGDLFTGLNELRHARLRLGDRWPTCCYLPDSATDEVVERYGIEPGSEAAKQVLTAWAWHQSRDVYRLEGRFLRAVTDARLEGAFLPALFARLPTFCGFVETPTLPFDGFWLRSDWVEDGLRVQLTTLLGERMKSFTLGAGVRLEELGSLERGCLAVALGLMVAASAGDVAELVGQAKERGDITTVGLPPRLWLVGRRASADLPDQPSYAGAWKLSESVAFESQGRKHWPTSVELS